MSGELGSGGPEPLDRILRDPEALRALEKLVDVAVKLDRSGLLDLASALAEGRILRELLEAALTGGGLRILDSLSEAVKELGEVVDTVLEEARPVGVMGLIRALGDPEVQRGLGRLIALLKALGRLRLEEILRGGGAQPRG